MRNYRFTDFTLLLALLILPYRTDAQQPTPTATSIPPTVNTNPIPNTPIEPGLVIPPPTQPPAYIPFKQLPPVTFDEFNDGVGIAQQTARGKNLQARILWIDATANLDRINTPAKIAALVTQIKQAGFNTIVLDVKPIVGLTLYPSRYAPKLTTWILTYASRSLPAEFDPLDAFVRDSHAAGLQLVANFNAFSEGHTIVHQGPGYDHPEWQTILYDTQMHISGAGNPALTYAISDRVNTLPASDQHLAVFTDTSKLTGSLAGNLIALLDANKQVVAQVDGAGWGATAPTLQDGGSILVGTGAAAQFLRQNAAVGERLLVGSLPVFVPIRERPDRQVPLMVNPNRSDVQQRMLNMVGEVVTNYPVDGIIFDDRLRYAGINADFSPETRQQFETYVGHAINWPDDIFHYDVAYPSMARLIIPGPQYDAWLVFRALTLRNFLAAVVTRVKSIRATVTVSTYTGSNYSDYPLLGPNWAADDFSAGLHFSTPSFQKTGYAGLLDWMTTGCYYPTATISEALASGKSIGETIEASGQFSNRAANDQTWVYAGISLNGFNGHPELLANALQAAAATTQGIMVFDLSQNIDQFWPTFHSAFALPAQAPHSVPGLLDDVRRQHTTNKANSILMPPVIIYRGASGTGL